MGSQPDCIHLKKEKKKKKKRKKLAKPFCFKSSDGFFLIALNFSLFQVREWEVHINS